MVQSTGKVSKHDTSSLEYLASLRNSLYYDPVNKYHYIQLPSHPDLRLVAPSAGTEEGIVRLFNIPSVGERLFRLPYPMPKSFAETMLSERIASNEALLAKLPIPNTSNSTSSTSIPISQPSTRVTFPGFPLNSLIHIPSSSSPQPKIIGDIALFPHSYHFSPKPLTPGQVLALPLEEQVWDFGYVLDPTYKGKGVMSEIVGCIIEGWVKGWMGIGSVGAFADIDNPASHSVLKKNGMEMVSTHVTDWPEEKGGGKRDTGRFLRKLQ